MKTLLKLVGSLAVILLLAAGAGFAYLKFAFPKVGPAPALTIAATPELVERGRYIANHVAVCIDCHSTRDWQYFAGPIIPGTEGKGGEKFGRDAGLPGDIYSKNITPAALGNWTDGEVLRAITTGVSRDGTPLFPIMQWPAYNHMAEEDAHAVVAYLRTLPAVPGEVPERSLDFPLNLIVRTMPREASPQPKPDPSDTVAYGRYLTTIAACAECHTPAVKGEKVPGMEFAGGFEFGYPDGSVVRSVNITPDPETGIGGWDRDFFIQRFKQYARPDAHRIPAKPGEFNTVMPWLMYAGMTEQDLGAIYDFLRTVQPVKNKVEKFAPASGRKS